MKSKSRYFRLSQLCEGIGTLDRSIMHDKDVIELHYDSRKAGSGSLFFAVKGLKDDGNKYIEDVIKKGAAGIVTDEREAYLRFSAGIDMVLVRDAEGIMTAVGDRFYDNVLERMNLIGITGTNGKSSTAMFIHSIINNWNKGCGLLGTIYNDLGEGFIKADMTTPLALDSLQSFSMMQEKGISWAVMEVSSHSIHRKRVKNFPFLIGALTNISQDHLDYHGNMDEYRKVKMSFFDHVQEGGYCIIPYTLAQDSALKSLAGKKNLLTFNDPAGDYYIRQKKYSDRMVLLWIRTPDGEISVSTGYLNDFMHENILLAIAVSKSIGITNSCIAKSIENFKGIPGRVEVVYDDDFKAVVDYAHTPDAILRVIKEFRMTHPGSRIITVFGAGGNKDKSKRPLMGKYASMFSDVLILTSDNPRDERPLDIISDIYRGIDKDCLKSLEVIIQDDRRKAIEIAVEYAGPGDIILLLGKGHEESLEEGGRFYHFSDREILKESINARGKNA